MTFLLRESQYPIITVMMTNEIRSDSATSKTYPLSAVKTTSVLLTTSAFLRAETTRPMASSISPRASPKAPRSVVLRNRRPAGIVTIIEGGEFV